MRIGCLQRTAGFGAWAVGPRVRDGSCQIQKPQQHVSWVNVGRGKPVNRQPSGRPSVGLVGCGAAGGLGTVTFLLQLLLLDTFPLQIECKDKLQREHVDGLHREAMA